MNNGSSNSSLSSSTSYSSASGSSSSTTAKSSTNQNVGAGAVAAHVRGLQWLMFLAALVAVAMAVFAVVVGQRQQEKKAHLLQGSVLRRMNLFSNFCNSALSDSTARPSRAVEMTMPGDDYDEIDKYNDRKHSTVV